MTTSSPIRDVHFQNPRCPKLGIEILTLEELFDRRIDHLLEAPQRVHFYHIFLFTHGTGSHLIDFVSCQYDDKTLSFVSKGQVQQFQVNRENRGFIIIFTAEFLYQNATELNLFHSQHIFEHALFAPSIRLSEEQHQLLHRLSLIIQDEYLKPVDELSSEILGHLLRVMLLHIQRIQKTNTLGKRVAPHYQKFITFRRLLERDLGKFRGVLYYADQLGVSAKKLNEITRQVLNKTAKEFIEEQVVLETQRLLAQGHMPIKEIAYQLGFSEPTNMVKFFKKHTGISPAAFRHRFHPTP